jgi:acetylornithine deacetylase/succinyl-diaminopimelate desuccinylase-like protein
VPIDEASLRAEVGARALEGEEGYSVLERLWARPTLDVHGIVGGHLLEGTKTVIPARATAKLSMRLVPDQDPLAILESLRAYVEELRTPGVSVAVRELGHSRPVAFGADHRGASAMRAALGETFGTEPVLARMGGSIPVTDDLQQALGADMVVMGFGLPDDGNHAPNERFSVAHFHGATEAMLRMMAGLA